MEINLSVPEWVMWAIGAPTAIAVLALAVFGLLFLWAFWGKLY